MQITGLVIHVQQEKRSWSLDVQYCNRMHSDEPFALGKIDHAQLPFNFWVQSIIIIID